MQPGKRVTFKFKGTEAAATVTAVAGTGPSGKKTLDLVFDGGNAENVPHGDDRQGNNPFWLLDTETDTPPDRRAPLDKQPIKMAAALDEGRLPESDRRSE